MDLYIGIINYISQLTIAEAIASILVVIGVYRISIPKFDGQLIMAVAQGFWIFHATFANSPGLLAQSIILFILNIKAIVSWHKKSIGVPCHK